MTTKARAVSFAICSLVATALHAHDSWFARDGDTVTLVTGTRFPRAELVAPAESIARKECSTNGGANACWVELHEFDITLDDRIVDVYLREVHPDEAVRAQWQALHANRKEWRERYRKFARIEWGDDGNTTAEQRQSVRQPANLPLEVLPIGNTAFAKGTQARFVVLSQGKPVAGRPVELVSEKNPLGLWSRTDAQGEVAWPLPFGGGWLVRTILIETDGAERFRSRFATFAFEAR